MQIQATYEDGRLEFDRPVQFARRRFGVRVEVPDQELVQPIASNPIAAASDPAPATQAEMAASGASLPAEASRWLTRLETLRAEAIADQRARTGTSSESNRSDSMRLRCARTVDHGFVT